MSLNYVFFRLFTEYFLSVAQRQQRKTKRSVLQMLQVCACLYYNTHANSNTDTHTHTLQTHTGLSDSVQLTQTAAERETHTNTHLQVCLHTLLRTLINPDQPINNNQSQSRNILTGSELKLNPHTHPARPSENTLNRFVNLD